ncbi:glycoside hydrolase family 72 protein [Jackrogersella minutella]|nr:glycoside hydrolase family 72 protein [Jackrogersella minutella]
MDPQPITPITISGRYFFRGHERFFVNGVVYRPLDPEGDPIDPLSHEHLPILERCMPLFKELALNTLYIFYLDETKNHDAAMSMLAEAGIYVLPCIAWTRYDRSFENKDAIMRCYFQAVDAMAKYPNTLGIILSYELIISIVKTTLAPLLRGAVRDVKRYIRLLAKKKDQRVIPVGITAKDMSPLLKLQFDYFSSEPASDAIDFFTFNNFGWSSRSTLSESGYETLLGMFAATPIPVFFSMYGSNTSHPRSFHETMTIYKDLDMVKIFSGGIVFEFFETAREHGLIQLELYPETDEFNLIKLYDFLSLHRSLRFSFMKLPSFFSNSLWNEFKGSRPQQPKPSIYWMADRMVPKSLLRWDDIEAGIDDSEWVDVANDIGELTQNDLLDSVWENVNVDDIEP